MAEMKKNTNNSEDQLKELRRENRRLKEEQARKEEEFNKTIEAMQAQLNVLMQAFAQKEAIATPKDETKEMVVVGCRAFSGAPLSNVDSSLCYNFECGEEKEIPVEELRELLKESMYRNNKRLFANGIFYFKDEKNYERFKVRTTKDLSQHNVIRIITIEDKNKMKGEVNDLTDNLQNIGILHTFLYMIAEMLMDNNMSLRDWKYDNRVELERYVGMKFDDLIANSGLYRTLKNKR